MVIRMVVVLAVAVMVLVIAVMVGGMGILVHTIRLCGLRLFFGTVPGVRACIKFHDFCKLLVDTGVYLVV
jgi:hypothetical protein